MPSANPPEPFTLEHFRDWAGELELDNGEQWTLEPFQEAFVEDVFSGRPVCWLVVPEGNGKTTLLAGLALYFAEFQKTASIMVAAATREQAETLYQQAAGFVTRSPYLHEQKPDQIRVIKGKRAMDVPRFVCQDGHRRINHFEGSRIQIRAADDRAGDGIIPTLCIIDELHRHRDLKLYRTWRGKLAKRNGQLIVISTAGEPGTEFEEAREKIRQSSDDLTRDECFVRAVTDSVLLHEWAVPEDGDVEDLALVKRANPFSGITEATLAEKFNSPDFNMGHWRRFVCNLPTRSEFAAIQEAEWHAAAVSVDEWPVGEPCWLGLDVAWKWDTTSAVPLVIRDHDHRILGPSTVLVPPRDGTSLDPYKVERALIELYNRNPFHTVVMDTARAEQLAEWISKEFNVYVIDRAQTNEKAVEDYERFMQALREGWLKHVSDADLTRHALNAIARVLPTGAARFDRPHTSRLGEGKQDQRVIDALVAAAMAHSMAHDELTGGGGIVY